MSAFFSNQAISQANSINLETDHRCQRKMIVLSHYSYSKNSLGFFIYSKRKGYGVSLFLTNIAHWIASGTPIDLEARSKGECHHNDLGYMTLFPDQLLPKISLRNDDYVRPVLAVDIRLNGKRNC